MRILYILDYGTVGGATHALVDMVLQMKRLGVIPIVATGGPHSSFNDYLSSLGIENFSLGHYTALAQINYQSFKWPFRLLKLSTRYYINEYRAILKFNKYLQNNRIDIIHTNSARNSIGCKLSLKYEIPHLMHIREFADSDFGCVSLLPHYIQRYKEGTQCFVAISQAVKRHWIKKGLTENNIRLIYDGVSFQNITISGDDDKKKRQLHIIIAGGIYPTKGQHLAVEALGYLPEQIRDSIMLDIAGWGSPKYIESMKQYAKERGYEKNISFLGSISNVHERTGLYQIGLTCSKSEGFGLVTAEYMHGQLGVIASNSGACPELIENGTCGQLFESGNPKDLARCIERYYNDRNLLIQHSREARKKALAEYTDEINAKNIYNLYTKLLNGSN